MQPRRSPVSDGTSLVHSGLCPPWLPYGMRRRMWAKRMRAPHDRARDVPAAPGAEWGMARRKTAAETAETLGRRTISAATRGNSNLTLSLFLTRFHMKLENHWWRFSCRKWNVFHSQSHSRASSWMGLSWIRLYHFQTHLCTQLWMPNRATL